MTAKQLDGLFAMMTLVAIPANIPFEAWVVSTLWSWHIEPLVGVGLPFWSAVGLLAVRSVVLAIYRPEPHDKPEDASAKGFGRAVGRFTVQVVMLAIGWLALVAGR